MLGNYILDKKRFLLTQVIIFIIGLFIASFFYGLAYALSYALGALVMFAGNMIFFIRLFVKKQFSPTTEVIILFLCEFIKLILVAILTIIISIYIKPKIFSYIFGLISLQLVSCFIVLMFKRVR